MIGASYSIDLQKIIFLSCADLFSFFRAVIYCFMFLRSGGPLGRMQTLVFYEMRAVARLLHNVKNFSQIRRGVAVLSPSQNVSSRTVKLELKNESLSSNRYMGARYQHTEVDRGPGYRFMNETEKLKLDYLIENATLSKSLTPELEDEIAQGKRGKKYLLHQVELPLPLISFSQE